MPNGLLPPLTRRQLVRYTTAGWAEHDPVLLLSELGHDVDLDRVKIGDGVTPWSERPWLGQDLADELLPYMVNVPATVPPSAASGVVTTAFQSSCFYNVNTYCTLALGNWMEWQFLVAAGTYTLRTLWQRNANEGISTITFDGGPVVETIDMYGAFASNQIKDTTGIVLSAGLHVIRYSALTKNASATSAAQVLHGFSLTRTGA